MAEEEIQEEEDGCKKGPEQRRPALEPLCTIYRVSNGWLIETDGVEIPVHEVIEEREEDHEWGEVRAGERLMWHLVDLLGLFGSRYDKYRLRIRLEPGDKYIGD